MGPKNGCAPDDVLIPDAQRIVSRVILSDVAW
jgi:hypothetical protein